MKNKLLLFLIISLFMTAPTNAAVLFETNFDSMANWTTPQAQTSTTAGCFDNTATEGEGCDVGAAPSPFTSYRYVSERPCSVSGANTMNIGGVNYSVLDNAVATGFSPYGGSGKSFVFWNEPCLTEGQSWGSDGILGYWLGATGYQELYIRYKIRFMPGWVWNTSSSPMMKLGHWGHYSGLPTNPFGFFSDQTFPLFVPGLAKYGSGTYPLELYLYSADTTGATRQEAGYQICGNYTDPTTAGCPNDNNWHTLEYHMKLNTAAGTANGIKQAWWDGTQVLNITDVEWVRSGDPANYGINHIMLGGNNYNLYSSGGEQWYSLDDLVISTTYVGTSYEIAGADTTPDAFTFTDVVNATLSAQYTSNTITVTGINAAATISITGGTYSVNGGAYTSNAGTVNVNDNVAVRVTSSGSYSTAVNVVLTIGGVSDTYTVTTVAAPATGVIYTGVNFQGVRMQ